MSEKEEYANMYRYIQNLPQEDKVPDQEYEKRLEVCRKCDSLLNGICIECGCYVEMRAALSVRHCPLGSKNW